MTAAKNVYALMLALVIVLSGCFGNTADDTDAQEPEDTVDTTTTIVNNFYNTTTIQESEEWFTQGGIVDTQWYPDGLTVTADNPNVTECDEIGGTIQQINSSGGWFGPVSSDAVCDIYVSSITTQSGVMLVVHESYGVTSNTTCGNITIQGMFGVSDERRSYGSSMNCTHDFFFNDVERTYTDQTVDQIWSITYSLRNVTVV